MGTIREVIRFPARGRTKTLHEENHMHKITSSLLAGLLSVSFSGAAIAPSAAAQLYLPQQAPTASANVIDVAGRGDGSRYGADGYIRRDRIYRRHGASYWRGHRGYRHYRPGYRRHGDLWFPLAAFAAGAIISGAIANDRPPPAAAYGNAHVRWCSQRYRSYRAYDNTFQPYNGPRRQCISPY